MNIEALFFDIDQTLYDGSSDCVPESALMAIKKAQQKGIRAFICTGRPLSGALKINLGDVKWDGYITSNGASYYDADFNLLKSFAISKDKVDQMIKLCEKNDIALAFQNTEGMYVVSDRHGYVKKAFDFFGIEAPKSGTYHDEDINMFTIYQKDDFNYDIASSIEGLISVKGKANYADVMMKEINKGFGVTTARDLFGIKGLTMGFGDADNDLELILDSDIGVAMGNGTETIKKNADYVTSGILDDGIYNALRHFNLI